MAQQEIVHLVDDLDGGIADSTVTFGLDGRTYEIDLSDSHASALRDQLSVYVASARRKAGAPSGGGSTAAATDPQRPRTRSEARAMRIWARNNGFELADRGRIPAAISAAYRARDDDAAPSPEPVTPSAPSRGDTDASPTTQASPTAPSDASDAEVLTWHESRNYIIPADRSVNGLMRHRYRSAQS